VSCLGFGVRVVRVNCRLGFGVRLGLGSGMGADVRGSKCLTLVLSRAVGRQ